MVNLSKRELSQFLSSINSNNELRNACILNKNIKNLIKDLISYLDIIIDENNNKDFKKEKNREYKTKFEKNLKSLDNKNIKFGFLKYKTFNQENFSYLINFITPLLNPEFINDKKFCTQVHDKIKEFYDGL